MNISLQFLTPLPQSFSQQFISRFSPSSKDNIIKKVALISFIKIAFIFTKSMDWLYGRKDLNIVQRYKYIILATVAIVGRITFYVVLAIIAKNSIPSSS